MFAMILSESIYNCCSFYESYPSIIHITHVFLDPWLLLFHWAYLLCLMNFVTNFMVIYDCSIHIIFSLSTTLFGLIFCVHCILKYIMKVMIAFWKDNDTGKIPPRQSWNYVTILGRYHSISVFYQKILLILVPCPSIHYETWTSLSLIFLSMNVPQT